MFKRVALVLITVLALIAVLVVGSDYSSRYWSWRALSPAHIAASSQWYINNRASDIDGISAICVYALECTDDGARLAIVRDPDQYDFGALKNLIWNRRFEGICPGQTANLGLHLMRPPESNAVMPTDQAIWSFYHDRFIPMRGNWSGGAFSEEPWERCSIDGAAYLVQQGVLVDSKN
jgi:hypothetical protein